MSKIRKDGQPRVGTEADKKAKRKAAATEPQNDRRARAGHRIETKAVSAPAKGRA